MLPTVLVQLVTHDVWKRSRSSSPVKSQQVETQVGSAEDTSHLAGISRDAPVRRHEDSDSHGDTYGRTHRLRQPEQRQVGYPGIVRHPLLKVQSHLVPATSGGKATFHLHTSKTGL